MKDNLFGDFFKEKTVLITGHTGFMGSWLAIWLNELGAKVIGYALSPNTDKDNFVVTNLQDRITNIIGDIRNFDKINEVLIKNKPDIIFHLAAQPIVRKSYSFPKETFDTNVGGTVNICEAFRKCTESKVLINVTTDKVYENKEWIWGYRENDRLGGHEPYSVSKACSDLITSSYRKSYFNSKQNISNKMISTARSGNVIGGGDWKEDRLIPDCMRAIKDNKEIELRSPQSVRPWQHVLEPNRGYLILAKKMWEGDSKFSSSWNFGPGNSTIFCVNDIVDKIIKFYGKGSCRALAPHECDDLHETNLLLLDNSKAFRYLRWKPSLSIDDAIKLVCNWYSAETVDYDFDVNQIKSYLKLINIEH